MRDIAKRTKAAVIGIAESKFDSTVLDPDIYIENYGILRFDRNRHGGGVACYIRSDISYKLNSLLSNEIENVTFDILMAHTKPIIVGIISSLNFLIILKKIYLNLTQAIVRFSSQAISKLIFFENGKYVFGKFSSNNKSLDLFAINYHKCSSLFGLKQQIKCPTRATCNSSSILDHVLASFPDRVSQSGVIDVGISDHQLIYCARKTARIKSYWHKQITFRYLKNYSPEICEEALTKLSFPNYELFGDTGTAS